MAAIGVRDVWVPNESHQRTYLGAVDGKVGNGSPFRVELVDGVKDFLDFAGVVLLGDEMEDIPDGMFQMLLALKLLQDRVERGEKALCVPVQLVDRLQLEPFIHSKLTVTFWGLKGDNVYNFTTDRTRSSFPVDNSL